MANMFERPELIDTSAVINSVRRAVSHNTWDEDMSSSHVHVHALLGSLSTALAALRLLSAHNAARACA